MRLSSLVVIGFAGLLLAGAAPAAADDFAPTEEQTLRAAGLATDGPALLAFFRLRTTVTADQEKIRSLVRQLGDPSPQKAEQAAGELVALGPLALPWLRQAARETDDTELSIRARRCLEFLDGPKATILPAAVARLVALRRPPGAAEVLLDYLPFADDESVIEEIRNALAAVARHGDKVEPVLLRALEDPLPLRRAVAAEALGQAGVEEARPGLVKLLHDPRPVVRLRVALALANLREPTAVSTLITLLAELPPHLAQHAEDYLHTLAGEQAPKVTLGTDQAAQEKCRDAWAAWWQATEGPALLDEFKKRTLTDAARERALVLIRQLGNDSFEVREKATAELLEMGTAAVPFLRQAAGNPDAEVSQRARKCLDAIEKEKLSPLSPVTVRLAALRRPPGTVETLLAYLPSAEDEGVAGEVQAALAAITRRDGKADPALLRALDDKVPARRAAAAAALCQAGLAEVRPAVRKLLHDPEPAVRLRVALALAADREKEAVPVLISLLAELPPGQAEQAESFLHQLAGERAPKVTLGRDEASRQKCRDAWAAWWREHGPAIELVRLVPGAPRQLGYTAFALIENGQVVELGRDGKVRWQLDGLQYPADFHVLPGDRVLIAEYNSNRVTERNLKNEILWQKQLGAPAVSCQRLPNGNTFIATRMQILEVDPAGKEVLVINRPNGDLMAAHKLRDGQIVCTTSTGLCIKMDAAGKELKRFAVGNVAIGSLEVLPNGRVLIPQYNNNKVVEYDPEGKVVWEASVSQPLAAIRLANGNTLVSSYGTFQLQELDRSGKVVWEHKTGGRPGRVRRR
ncbi:MAG TPA: HEAT repeat domain-containing protein [Gemmataceae bacterium]|nr:HEAT repeat domain-containing protein [Gemmataceae bacterium]